MIPAPGDAPAPAGQITPRVHPLLPSRDIHEPAKHHQGSGALILLCGDQPLPWDGMAVRDPEGNQIRRRQNEDEEQCAQRRLPQPCRNHQPAHCPAEELEAGRSRPREHCGLPPQPEAGQQLHCKQHQGGKQQLLR
ncbi:hypothetical protein D3C73_1337240 [compost metagenome]